MNNNFTLNKFLPTSHSHILSRFVYTRSIISVLLLLVLASPVSAQEDPGILGESLKVAMWDMAQGRFDQARSQLKDFSDLQGRYVRMANDLLSQYETLQSEIQQAHQDAYDLYLEKMNDAVEHAKWRTNLLETSQSNDMESKDKSTFESESQDKVKGHWLNALGQLSLAKTLAERVNLTHAISEELQNKIVATSLEIAADYESEKKWLDSYLRVYSYLIALDEQNIEYENHARRLSRQATLINMYITDPNTDAISWEEQREGVTFSIIQRGLEQLHHQYVKVPDYQDMILKGLDYCRYLAETPKLSEVFTSIKNEILVEKYLQELDELAVLAKSKEPEQLNDTQVLEFLRHAQFINHDSLKLPEKVILAEFTEGAFSALDGYTYLVWPSEVADFQKDMTNEFFGVGIEIGMPRDPNNLKGQLTVTSLLLDSPAMRAGLDAEDQIVAIDGKSSENITLQMAVKRITGAKGTNVILTIDRKGFDEPKDFTVKRDRIVVQTIRGLWRDPTGQWQHFIDRDQGIVYVQIKSFSGKTASGLKKVIKQLDRESNLKGLILDLRRNSGGYLSSAVEIVDHFITQGPIVSTRPRNPKEGYMDLAKVEGTFRSDVPMVVLVDSMSASASEIVSGALKDHGRALIVGARTFGKGSVQTIQKLWPGQAEMKMTIAYYYLPSNRRVHRDPKDKANKDYGVEPDMTIELTNKQMVKHYEVQRDVAILHQNDQSNSVHKHKSTDLEKVLASDPVLRIALLCMNAEIAAREMEQEQVAELVMN